MTDSHPDPQPTLDRPADALSGIRTVVDAIRLANLSHELPEMLDAVLDGVSGLMAYDAAGVYVIDPETQAWRGQRSRGYTQNAARMELPFEPKGLVGRVLASGRSMLVDDPTATPDHLEGRPSTRTEILVPLVGSRGRIIGALNVESDRPSAYDTLSLELLALFASGVAGPIENAMLYAERLERRGAEDELIVARRVMDELLPHHTPAIEGFDIAGLHRSSREVGGDYYELIPLADAHWGVAIADVVGKGVAAALLVSAMRASLSSLARQELALRAILRRANRFFHASVAEGKYVTLFYAVLDVPSRRLIYVNAGHVPPVLLRTSGEVRLLEAGGFPLGLFDEPRYEEGFVHLHAGDVLALYTDGVTEACDAADEPYERTRLIEVLRRVQAQSAAAICDAIVTDVLGFSGPDAEDDQTLLVIKAT